MNTFDHSDLICSVNAAYALYAQPFNNCYEKYLNDYINILHKMIKILSSDDIDKLTTAIKNIIIIPPLMQNLINEFYYMYKSSCQIEYPYSTELERDTGILCMLASICMAVNTKDIYKKVITFAENLLVNDSKLLSRIKILDVQLLFEDNPDIKHIEHINNILIFVYDQVKKSDDLLDRITYCKIFYIYEKIINILKVNMNIIPDELLIVDKYLNLTYDRKYEFISNKLNINSTNTIEIIQLFQNILVIYKNNHGSKYETHETNLESFKFLENKLLYLYKYSSYFCGFLSYEFLYLKK